jgi:hypothetical protein
MPPQPLRDYLREQMSHVGGGVHAVDIPLPPQAYALGSMAMPYHPYGFTINSGFNDDRNHRGYDYLSSGPYGIAFETVVSIINGIVITLCRKA